MTIDRRNFLKTAAGASLLLGVNAGAEQELHSPKQTKDKPAFSADRPDVAVIGAGVFGMWTAFYLNRLGANVTLIDMYGPGNSRSTSGDETREVKSSYGNRPFGLQWAAWAKEATERWTRWDAEWRDKQHPRLFFNAGSLVLRPQLTSVDEKTIANWEQLGIPYEKLGQSEIQQRFPVINSERFGGALFEPGAGIVRSRRSLEAVAEVFESEGGELMIDQSVPPAEDGSTLKELTLQSGAIVSAAKYVFACGPWLPKALPDAMGRRLRTPMGNVYYFGTPPGDRRFEYPNFPSIDVPGATGWAALTRDNRGFRFRTGGQLQDDPDTSDRTIPPQFIATARDMLASYLPAMAGAPLLEMRSSHFEYSADGNLLVDTHPTLDNVWIAGAGSAEGFKFGPVVGEYVARRVLEQDTDAELAAAFTLKDIEFADYPQPEEPGWLDRKIEAYCRKRL